MDYIEDDFTDALIDAICGEEAEAAFEAEVAKLETAFARGAFKRLYTVAPFIVK